MKIIVFSLCCLFYFVLHATAGGEYYQYVDDSGVKHFTENYAEVPDQYKPQIKIHKEINTPETKSQQNPEQKPDQTSDKKSALFSAESLVVQKDDLNKEYNAIIEKRKILTLKKETMGQIEYNKQATQLNADIQAYQEKRNVYEQRVEEYNKQINTTKPKLAEESEKP